MSLMKHFRLVFGLALIPIGAYLIYGPGHKKNQLLNSYYLKRDLQLNRLNQLDGGRPSAPWSLREQEASGAQEEYKYEEHIASNAQEEDENPLPPPPLRA